MAKLSIDVIETALAERGLHTDYVGTDETTVYTITGEYRTIELFQGVTGEHYRPDFLVEAVLYREAPERVTDAFEDVETVKDFLRVVDECFA